MLRKLAAKTLVVDSDVVCGNDDLSSVGRGEREGWAVFTNAEAEDVDAGFVDGGRAVELAMLSAWPGQTIMVSPRLATQTSTTFAGSRTAC